MIGQMKESKDLIYYLKKFNRKERFFLIGQALGNPDFKLGSDFRKELSRILDIKIPVNAFVAMDYHLDWIYASLLLLRGIQLREEILIDKISVNDNQEDIDLIVAFKQMNKYFIILIEAKGDTNWKNSQMKSKIPKLNIIFDLSKEYSEYLESFLVLMSPNRPEKLIYDDWDRWMDNSNKPYCMRLKMPNEFYIIKRIGTPDIGNNDSKKFKIIKKLKQFK